VVESLNDQSFVFLRVCYLEMFFDNGSKEMLVSMTGFGRATGEHQGITGVVEVRSVNHRFLEVLLQL